MKRLLGCYDPSWNDYKMNPNPSFIFNKLTKQLSKSQNKFQKKKEIVNNSIRICIECGNKAVLIDKNKLYCNNCNFQFKIKEDKNGCNM